MTKLQLFKKACAALWGEYYRSEAARQLDAGLRTVMRWDAGERPVPEEKMQRLMELLIERQTEIAKLTGQMPKVSS